MLSLSDAIIVAVQAHDGQVDKSGRAYILHDLSVMLAVEDRESLRQVAVLHDVLEDTTVTMNLLKLHGFSPDVLEALDAITRRKSEHYWDYIERCKENPIARTVKIADLKDNLRPDRCKNIPKSLQERYRKAPLVLF